MAAMTCKEAEMIAAKTRCRGVVFMATDSVHPKIGRCQIAKVEVHDHSRARFFFVLTCDVFGCLGFYPTGTGFHPWESDARRFFGGRQGLGNHRPIEKVWGASLPMPFPVGQAEAIALMGDWCAVEPAKRPETSVR